MERCFIATIESDFIKEYENYKALAEEQRKFVKEFMDEKEIESDRFIVGGDGLVNTPFEEYNKSDIILSIKPTQNDIKNFEKMLKKPNKNHGLCGFKKNSKIAKEFAQGCVDKKIVINLWKPRVGDYFKSINFHGCSWGLFKLKDTYYVRVESNYLKKDDTPEGLIEIKQSEYYLAKEELEKKTA